jgi:prevent-host-death family protein
MDGPYSVTKLRANLYRLLDRVLETGVPVEIERHGRRLLIVPADRKGRLERLEPHDEYIGGEPGDLVHLDWSTEWRP